MAILESDHDRNTKIARRMENESMSYIAILQHYLPPRKLNKHVFRKIHIETYLYLNYLIRFSRICKAL